MGAKKGKISLLGIKDADFQLYLRDQIWRLLIIFRGTTPENNE